MKRPKGMLRRVIVAAALVVVAVLAGCGDDGDDDALTSTTGSEGNPGITVEEALSTSSDRVLVRGLLIAIDRGPVTLCGGPIMESAPPQCGEPSLEVKGLDLAKVDGLRHLDGWSEGDVRLLGRVNNGVLTIEPESQPD